MVRSTAGAVHRSTKLVTAVLGVHGHLVVLGADGGTEAVLLVACACHGQEIDDETPDVEDVDERDDPLEDGSFVDSVVATFQDTKCDCEAAFHENEGELDPEADAEDAVFAEVHAETLVLGADEDCGDDVATTGSICQYLSRDTDRTFREYIHEASQHSLVNIREAPGVEDGQEEQAEAADNSKSNGEAGKDLLGDVVIHGETALVSEPTLHAESGIEQHNHDRRSSNEQWLAPSSRTKS